MSEHKTRPLAGFIFIMAVILFRIKKTATSVAVKLRIGRIQG